MWDLSPACLWSKLIDNDLLKGEDSVVNVHDVLNVVLQCILILLDNANELVPEKKMYHLERLKGI